MAKFYQVGGSVRDALAGVASKDTDYAVEAPSFDAMREAILERGGEIFLETPKYLTIRARVPKLGACDFTLCRRDGVYNDGRHPDTVEPGTIQEDLARRDFTMNAMAIDEEGHFIDPFGGRADLDMGVLRCVGKTVDRFSEDGLRMVRALRFMITKSLKPTEGIIACLLKPDFFVPRLKGVSTERVREELNKMFAHDTVESMKLLNFYSEMRDYLFSLEGLWLKPTLEKVRCQITTRQ